MELSSQPQSAEGGWVLMALTYLNWLVEKTASSASKVYAQETLTGSRVYKSNIQNVQGIIQGY